MLNVGLEVQQQIRGGDGTLLWSGAQVVGTSYMIQVAAANTGPLMGQAVQWDATNSVIPRPETTAAGASPTSDLPMSLAMYGVQSPASAGAVNIIGVAQDPIPAGKKGVVAGEGSIVCVNTTATLLAIGAFVGSSATAGLCAVVAVGAATNVYLGAVLKINQVASPGTGSTAWAGILVKGGSAAVS